MEDTDEFLGVDCAARFAGDVRGHRSRSKMSVEALFTSKRFTRFQIEGPIVSDASIVTANQFPSISDLRELKEFVRKSRVHVVREDEDERIEQSEEHTSELQ